MTRLSPVFKALCPASRRLPGAIPSALCATLLLAACGGGTVDAGDPAAASATTAVAGDGATNRQTIESASRKRVAPGTAATIAAPNAVTPTTGGSTYTGRGWFVDSDAGNDAADGSGATPWKTLARAATQSLAAGDAVLLKCGGVWRESFTISQANAPAGGATLGAWGACTTLKLPVITGADPVAGVSWTLVAGFGGKPVYAAPWSKPVATLYWNGVPLTRARYPNNGGIGHEFGLIASMRDAKTLVPGAADAAMLRNFSLAGAKAFIRTNAWLVESQDIASSDATGAITLKAPTTYPAQAGEGFFVEGNLAFLDTAGEWFQDPATGLLYVWAPSGLSPATGLLETATRSLGVTVSNVAASHVDKIAFDRQTGQSLFLADAQNTVVTDVSSSYVGATAILIDGATAAQSSGSSVQRATISNAGTTGISANSPALRILDSQIDSSGVASYSTGVSAGVYVGSVGGVVQGNRISNSAFAAIVLANATGATVSGNVLTQACKRFTDCGAIYSGGAPTAAQRTTISSNTITDLVPNPEGAIGGATTLVAGVYLDEGSSTHDVTNNMIARTNVGINLHNTSNDTVQLNHVWLTDRASVRVHNSSATETVRGNVIQDNELFGSAQLLASVPATTAPTAQQVYPQEWVHGSDATMMFKGVNPNISRRNVAATMTATALVRWSMLSGLTQQTLNSTQWSAYGSAETFRAAYAARPFLVSSGGANLIQNSALQAAGAGWLFWSPTPAAGGTMSYGTCGVTGCGDFAPGTTTDFLMSNTFQMSSAAGANLYYLRVHAQGVTRDTSLTMAINRSGGDWGQLGLVLMNQVISGSSMTSVDAMFNASSSDVARLNMTGMAAQAVRLRDVTVAQVGSYELLSPALESTLLTNETSAAKSIACPTTQLRTCTVSDLSGLAVTWPVTLTPNSAMVVLSNDAKWKP